VTVLDGLTMGFYDFQLDLTWTATSKPTTVNSTDSFTGKKSRDQDREPYALAQRPSRGDGYGGRARLWLSTPDTV